MWACAVSPDGSLVATACETEPFVRVWGSSGAAREVGDHEGEVKDCCFTADGASLVLASADGTLSVWDTASREKRGVLQGTGGEVRRCRPAPDGRIVSCGLDDTVRLWAIPTGATATAAHHPGGVTDCAMSPDGSFFVTVGATGLRVWDAATLGCAHHRPLDGGVTCALSPDGVRLAVSSSAGVEVWATKDWRPIGRLGGQRFRLHDLTFTADGTRVCAAGYTVDAERFEDRRLGAVERTIQRALGRDRVSTTTFRVAVWPLPSGRRFGRAPEPAWSGPERGRLCTATPDGRILLADPARGVTLWDPATPEADGQRATESTRANWVRAMAVSPDGTTYGTVGEDGIVAAWDAATGRCRWSVDAHESDVMKCAFTGDGCWVVSASLDSTVRVMAVDTGQPGGGIALPNPLTALAVHPTQPIVYGCDAGGAIYLLEARVARPSIGMAGRESLFAIGALPALLPGRSTCAGV